MRILFQGLLAGLLFVPLAIAADDVKKDDKKPTPPKKLEWGNYVEAGKIVGEIDKVSKDGFTIKVTHLVPQAPKFYKGRPQAGQPKVKVESIDMTFHENGLVRWVKMPIKLDDKGKKAQWTDKEIQELKSPQGAPGYAASREDLDSGSIVEVTYMRPKDIKAETAVTGDFRIKFVVIQGVDPKATPAKKDDKKKPVDKKDDK
jgi:hypothetical protein